jgi:hypothetical protein
MNARSKPSQIKNKRLVQLQVEQAMVKYWTDVTGLIWQDGPVQLDPVGHAQNPRYRLKKHQETI